MKEDVPLPPVVTMWNALCTNKAITWINDCVDRIAQYMDIKPITNPTTIDFPITLE